MTQTGLFDEPQAAPATAPTQARVERVQSSAGQEACRSEPPRIGADNIPSFSKGDPVTLGGREYRFHQGCGEFVWLAALDAGIAGPFYWHSAQEIRLGASQGVSFVAPKEPEVIGKAEDLSRPERLKAAQSKLAACETNGPEYGAALGELRAAMRGGDDVRA